jgi:hypothetical protein
MHPTQGRGPREDPDRGVFFSEHAMRLANKMKVRILAAVSDNRVNRALTAKHTSMISGKWRAFGPSGRYGGGYKPLRWDTSQATLASFRPTPTRCRSYSRRRQWRMRLETAPQQLNTRDDASGSPISPSLLVEGLGSSLDRKQLNRRLALHTASI